MKLKSKNLKTSFFYIIIPIILVSILGFFLYQSNQRIKTLKSGIDLKPRPFSELLATDFADVKDEVADPGKCDGNKILNQINQDSKNPNLVNNWKNYNPNIHKLTILDNCWRQYENEYVKFKFRDLNGSLRMDGPDDFYITDKYGTGFGVIALDYYGPDYFSSVNRFKDSGNFIDMNVFTNPSEVEIFRSREWLHSGGVTINYSLYTINLPGKNKYIYVRGRSDRIAKDILSTIEIKK